MRDRNGVASCLISLTDRVWGCSFTFRMFGFGVDTVCGLVVPMRLVQKCLPGMMMAGHEIWARGLPLRDGDRSYW